MILKDSRNMVAAEIFQIVTEIYSKI